MAIGACGRWTALGVSFDGHAHFPLYSGLAPSSSTSVVFGHPVIADRQGEELFIQVTCVETEEDFTCRTWHVALNNPTERTITTVLRKGMPLLKKLHVPTGSVTLESGEYRILGQS